MEDSGDWLKCGILYFTLHVSKANKPLKFKTSSSAHLVKFVGGLCLRICCLTLARPLHIPWCPFAALQMKRRCHRISVPLVNSAVPPQCLNCRMFKVLWQLRTFPSCRDVFDISLSKCTVMASCFIFPSTCPLALYSESHGMRACYAIKKIIYNLQKNRTVGLKH